MQRRGGTVQLAKGMPLALAERIRRMPGVKEVISGLMDMVAFEKQGLFMVIVNGWEADCPVLDRVAITAGRRLRNGDRRQVMLGRILAANLRKAAGRHAWNSTPSRSRWSGIFESFSVYENGAVFMLMEELQRQMDRPGQATGFVVQVEPPGDPRVIERVRREIEAIDPAIAATPCAEFVRSLKQMQVTRAMSWVAAAIALADRRDRRAQYHGHERFGTATGDRRHSVPWAGGNGKWSSSSWPRRFCLRQAAPRRERR